MAVAAAAVPAGAAAAHLRLHLRHPFGRLALREELAELDELVAQARRCPSK